MVDHQSPGKVDAMRRELHLLFMRSEEYGAFWQRQVHLSLHVYICILIYMHIYSVLQVQRLTKPKAMIRK